MFYKAICILLLYETNYLVLIKNKHDGSCGYKVERLSSNPVLRNMVQKTLHLQLKDPGSKITLGNTVRTLWREIFMYMNGQKVDSLMKSQ